MIKFLLLSALLCLRFLASGQVIKNTLLQYGTLPQLPMSSPNTAMSLFLLNQRMSIGNNIYQSNSLAGSLPLVHRGSGSTFGGVGVFFQKKICTGDWLESSSVGISLAYRLNIRRDQFVDFGLQSTIAIVKTAIEKITTGNQWLASEFRFDPTADLGEYIIRNRQSYLKINSGLRWSRVNPENGKTNISAALAAINLNKPKSSFLNSNASLPIVYLATFNSTIYSSKSFELISVAILSKDQSIWSASGQLTANVNFRSENPFDLLSTGSIGWIIQVDDAGRVGTGIAFNQPNYALAFGYNFPGHKRSDFFTTSFELGLLIRTAPKKLTKASPLPTAEQPVRVFQFQKEQPVKKLEGIKELEKEIKTIDNVTSVRFELERNFRFGFGDAVLNPEAMAYLDNIAQFLVDHPEYNLQIIGHTDNVGKSVVNEKLSEVRAMSVLNYLKEKGINGARLKSKGQGDREPIAPNDSEENRARNRRVQFILYIEKK